ncbi:hypothetical protein [Rhizobium oryziradicis]|uniref:hypothetical protein n=1 Tax=Rhizobium oryziradicis TaxID=1867956 RepID=UPI000AB38C99|nr:hypothetical protein [Rhizobium oryziradicis]
MNVAVVAHSDWSIDRKKRWMSVAIRNGVRWQVHAPELVGDTLSLIDRMKVRSVAEGALLLGFDFPIGLPEACARATGLPRSDRVSGRTGIALPTTVAASPSTARSIRRGRAAPSARISSMLSA